MAYRNVVARNRKLYNEVKNAARRAKKRGRTLGGIGKTLATHSRSRRFTQEKMREGKWEQEELGALCVCVCVCVCDRTAKTYRLLCSSIGITRRQKSGQVYTRLRALRPTRGMLRDTAKQRKAPKRKLRCPLVVSCSFVSLFHLLLCVLLKRQKRMAEEKEKEPSKKERVPLAATSTL